MLAVQLKTDTFCQSPKNIYNFSPYALKFFNPSQATHVLNLVPETPHKDTYTEIPCTQQHRTLHKLFHLLYVDLLLPLDQALKTPPLYRVHNQTQLTTPPSSISERHTF